MIHRSTVLRAFKSLTVAVISVAATGCADEWAPAQSNLPQPEIVARAAWGEEHPAMEMHAAPGGEATWLWRVEAVLPDSVYRRGGTLNLLVTQPSWSVVDSLGNVFPGADGFELHVATPGDEFFWPRLHRLPLNLHANPEQRRWHRVTVAIPPGTETIGIEVFPGSMYFGNNAYDRVWVSVQEPFEFRNAVEDTTTRKRFATKDTL